MNYYSLTYFVHVTTSKYNGSGFINSLYQAKMVCVYDGIRS